MGNGIDPFSAKLFEGASTEVKLEAATRALGQAAKVFVLMEIRYSELLDQYQKLLEAHAELLKKESQKNWCEAVRERMKEREKRASSR